MSEFAYLHKLEIVTFQSPREVQLSDALPVFRSQGFTLHDDVLSLDRRGRIPPWQHLSIVEVEFQHNQEEVFGFEGGIWDSVSLKYLFASLPFELTDTFVKVVERTEQGLGIMPRYAGEAVKTADLKRAFDKHREELLHETAAEPGSESLAVFIQGTYPR